MVAPGSAEDLDRRGWPFGAAAARDAERGEAEEGQEGARWIQQE